MQTKESSRAILSELEFINLTSLENMNKILDCLRKETILELIDLFAGNRVHSSTVVLIMVNSAKRNKKNIIKMKNEIRK